MSSVRFDGTTTFLVVHARFTRELPSPREGQAQQAVSRELMLHKPTLKDLNALAQLKPEEVSQTTILNLDGAFKEFKDVETRKQAFVAVARYLEKNRYLQELCLDHHSISKAEADILVEALSKSPLQRLSMRHCHFEKSFSIRQIINALKSSPDFQFINLQHSIKPSMFNEMGRELVGDHESIKTKIILDWKANIAIQKVMSEYFLMSPRSVKTPREKPDIREVSVERKLALPGELKQEKELPSKSRFIYFSEKEDDERVILSGVWNKTSLKGKL